MTKPWHHFWILFYCFYLLSLDKCNSVSSKDSVYNPTSLVVTSQLVIDSESNIFSSALLLLYSFCPQKSKDIWSLQQGHSIKAEATSSSPVASDIMPTLLHNHSVKLQPPTYSNTTPSSFHQPPISKHLQHTSNIGCCSSDPLTLLFNLNSVGYYRFDCIQILIPCWHRMHYNCPFNSQ